MKLMHTDNRLFKTINVTLLYALALNIFVPGLNAMAQIASKTHDSGETLLYSAPFPGAEAPVTTASETIAPEAPSEEEIYQEALPQAAPTVQLAAASGGPGQPESSGFSLGSMDNLVDPFTGDFNYSIPLMDVEGYPITISYNSNVSMNDEASWVGLGWNLNVGSVSRDMRGIPDEFDGSQSVKRTFSLKPNNTTDGFKFGVIGGASYKIAGQRIFKIGLDLSLLWGTYKNTYLGLGKTFDFGFAARFSVGEPLFFGPQLGIGYSKDSKNGMGLSSSISAVGGYMNDSGKGGNGQLGLSWGTSFNSRAGLTQRSLSLGVMAMYGSKGSSGGGLGGATSFGSTFTCGSLTAIPRLELSSFNQSENNIIDVSLKYSPSKMASLSVSIGLETQLYNTTQTFEYSAGGKILYNPAYGYLNSQKRQTYDGPYNPIMDFNREPGQEFSEEMKNLPYAFPTYDLFYANASGMGATFRGQRRDVGAYHDGISAATSEGFANDFSGAFCIFSAGFGVELAYARTDMDASTETGKWGAASNTELFQFGPDAGNYFKGIGEPTPHDDQMLEAMHGLNPVSQVLDKASDRESILKTTTITSSAGTTTLSPGSVNGTNSAEIIANIYQPLTAGQLGGSYLSYNLNSFSVPASTVIPRVESVKKTNHFSGVDITTTEGMHYNYGIPAYTVTQNEVVFSNEGYSVDADGLASYTPGTDNSGNNAKGRANLYDKTELPGYASAFLLTSITSPDYIDRTADGPSLDDIGNYYKFNHTRLYGTANPFKWRFPLAANKALLDEGLLATTKDDISSYSYVEKEIWYTHSVESKNYVAEFILEDRTDAYGVSNENGTLDATRPLKRLQKIVLYNLNDRRTNQGNAKPLQTIEFEYNYSLCPENPANPVASGAASGKLTLTAIRVYSGAVSQETALTPYLFSYSTVNPPHNYRNVDRWGNYKPNDPAKPNNQFPYATQITNDAQNNIQAWKLIKISSPMGAELEISYGPDNYAYVQNKRAMEHLTIAGYTSAYELAYLSEKSTFNGTDHLSNQLHQSIDFSTLAPMAIDISPAWAATSSLINAMLKLTGFNTLYAISKDMATLKELKTLPNNVVVFRLNEDISAPTKAEADLKFRNQYLNMNPVEGATPHYLNEVYLKNRVRIEDGTSYYDVVPTFAKIQQDQVNFAPYFPFSPISATGVLPPNGSGQYQFGYIVLQNVTSSEENGYILMNPVQKTAMEFARLHLPDRVYGSCEGCTPKPEIDRKVLLGKDMYKVMMKAGYCGEVNLALSSVRCFDHDKFKYGGNARVMALLFRDNWDAISGEYDSEYQWNYRDYLTLVTRKFTDGVAAYEPGIGKDENPFYNWNRYTNKSVSFPDETRFTVEPVGESLFPGPVVGYRTMVTTFTGNQVTADNGTGYSIQHFYTSYEKPTRRASSDISKVKAKKNNIVYKEVDLFGFSQGHIVITNDFHGKLRDQEIFNRDQVSQSLTTYYYKDAFEEVPMIDREGDMHQDKIAWEYDICSDSRFSSSKAHSLTIGGGLIIPIPPFGLPWIFPTFGINTRHSGIYTQAINKHVNYSAVVDHIETVSLGSHNTVRDIAYDRYTGSSLLSSLEDEYNDPLYSLFYPSHWYHEDLQSPLLQPKATLTGTIASGTFTYSQYLGDYFSVGDQVEVKVGAGTAVLAQILVISPTTSTMKLILSSNGTAITGSGSTTVKLVKSNRKNRLQETMQAVLTKRNPLSADNTDLTFPTTDIINTGALSYHRRYQALCYASTRGKVPTNGVEAGQVFNPFPLGIMKELYPERRYTPQVERRSSEVQGIRFNGTLVDNLPDADADNFVLFYEYNATSQRWHPLTESGHPHYASGNLYKWNPGGESITFDEYGNALDAKDPISVYVAVQYGYSRLHKLATVAQATNAKQQEIGFDSFEDYRYNMNGIGLDVDMGHFDFAEEVRTDLGVHVNPTTTERHSGFYSLGITAGEMAVMTRPVSPADACAIPNTPPAGSTYSASACNCIKPFSPTVGATYIISLWGKGATLSSGAVYSDLKAVISFTGSGTTYTALPSGQIIDGWQRMEREFTVPSGATEIIITLTNGNGTSQVYYDDIRVHPFLSEMITTVYDPETMLPLATHDGYNFTSFYNYDENLMPVKARVETINGIQTISESEGSSIKHYKN